MSGPTPRKHKRKKPPIKKTIGQCCYCGYGEAVYTKGRVMCPSVTCTQIRKVWLELRKRDHEHI